MTPSRLIAVVLALGVIASPYSGIIPGWTPGLATVICFNALSLLGLNLIFGVIGMLAFGQAAFMALPAYGAGILDKFGFPFALDLFVGVAGTIAVAWVVARIFVRLPGVFLAVGTLGFGYVVEGLARAFPDVSGGASGLVFARGRQIGGDLWYVIAVVALVLGLAAYAWLVRGAFWRRLRTICHDELAAAVVGIDVTGVKSRVFTIGCSFAAIAGVMHAYYVGVVIPEDAGVDRSLEQVGMVMVGGLGYLLGPVIGTSLIDWLLIVSGYAQRYELLIYGTAFLVAVIYARDGLAGWIVPPWQWLARRLDGPHDDPVAPPPAAAATGGPLARRGVCLSVAGVSKRFGGVQALDDISFEVAFGEIFAMVGPNGAGKSTLFNIISGIEQPSSGTVRLGERDLTPLAIDQRAPSIGRSFQVARLVPDLTALENVMVRLDQIAPDMTEAQRAAIAMAQLEAFGLGDLARRPVRGLSLGQHKLIDLTRAAVGDPPLVLLDEPAVGLAQDELAHLAQLLEQLRQRGSAVFIVEHNIDFVAGIAARGIVLDSGRAIALGDIGEILVDPRVGAAYFGALT
ncbi:MAG TPA: ATP-binding cassette domain-containing protein [Stellaceae bacterium]|nr:ATP-binding cassette domain-containing protein [Stellaceae bacterium]